MQKHSLFQISGAFGKLYGQSRYITQFNNANDNSNDSNSSGRAHEKCITYVTALQFIYTSF